MPLRTFYTDSESAQIGITSVFFVLAAIDFTGNTLVCVIIIKNHYTRNNPVNYLLLNLAAADIMVALFVATQFVISNAFKHPEGTAGAVLCKLLSGGNFTWVGGAAYVFTLVAIAFERYYAVMYPNGSKGKLTDGKLKIIIPAIWIAAAILNIPLFWTIDYDKERDLCTDYWPEEWMPKANAMLWLWAAGVVPMVLMTVLYSRVVYSLWFDRRRGDHDEVIRRRVVILRKRVTTMVLTVSVIYGVCWSMPLTVSILISFTPTYNFDLVTKVASVVLVTCNSTINPFVYMVVNPRFRQKAKELLCCRSLPRARVHPAGTGLQTKDNTNTTEEGVVREESYQEESEGQIVA